jgi:predicted  nucleic acid-binding Zn-ribbon protein
VQDRDRALDRLRHRRANLAERAELAAAAAQVERCQAEADAVRVVRDPLTGEERRLESEATGLEEQATRVERRLYSGEVSSPRELQAMQADVEQLRRHARDVENRVLELMEQREPLDARLDTLGDDLERARGDLERSRESLRAAEAAIDAEAEVEVGARAVDAATIPPALLGDYERCRARNRGVGVARLTGVTCQGCHLSIPSTEAERIRRGDGDLAHCDNCGAILVAT